ncbi:MAG: nucleotidyltransferase domain-containing protein [Candidatus Humimicrobiaceae bacterium]
MINYYKEVLFAYIFGSQFTNKTNKFSDIDIAIFIDKVKVNDELYRYGYQAEALSFA